MTVQDRESRYERLQELLADEALQGLAAVERAELAELLAEFPEVDPDELALAAAAVDLCGLAPSDETLPELLAARIARDARAALSASVSPTPSVRARGVRQSRAAGWLAVAGWLAAAAGWMLVLRGAPPVEVADKQPSTPAESRQQLLGTPDLMTIPWTATEDPAAAGASGDVVWSDSLQQGFLRFAGVAPNDPSKSQYQLWIFDSRRDDAQPVDGGVFDIPPGGGEVVIPINAKLAIGEAKMFAVTVERPGGVVVSQRERIVTLAQKH